MVKSIIEKFYEKSTRSYLNGNFLYHFNKNLISVLEGGLDVEMYIEGKQVLTFFGGATNELKGINENIVLVYESKDEFKGFKLHDLGFIYYDASKKKSPLITLLI